MQRINNVCHFITSGSPSVVSVVKYAAKSLVAQTTFTSLIHSKNLVPSTVRGLNKRGCIRVSDDVLWVDIAIILSM